jgi:glycosyltransferase involved in cell wall biosynthesis
MKISVIIPVYNEARTIIEILKKVNIQKKYFDIEIIISEDCSTDLTVSLLKNHSQMYDKIFFSKKNNGKGAAINSVFELISGDVVIIQDADLEYDPNDYKDLIDPIINNKSNVVYGSRVLGKKRYEIKNFLSFWRIFFNHALTTISNLLNNQKLTDAHTCYKVFKFEVYKQLKLKEKGFGFCPEVNCQISKLKQKILEVPINYYGRTKAQGKKISFYDGIVAGYVILKYKIFY